MQIPRAPFTTAYQPYQPIDGEPEVVLRNNGASSDRPGPIKIEVVVGKDGRFSHPVVIDRHAHPIVVYASLEILRRQKPQKPARFEGEPVPALERVQTKMRFGG